METTDASPTPIPRGPGGSITVMRQSAGRRTRDIIAAAIHPEAPPPTIKMFRGIVSDGPVVEFRSIRVRPSKILHS